MTNKVQNQKFLLITSAFVLTLSLGGKFYFLHHPPIAFFGISFSDLMLKAGAAITKPTPIPYRDTYMEYPVLIGIFFYLVSLVSRNSNEYFLISGAVLAVSGVLTTWLLMQMNANIWKFWILAPSLFLFTIYNWDMLAVFFMVLGIYLFLKHKPFWGSLATTLGVWAKLFPIFVLAAVGLDFLKKKQWKNAAVISLTFAVTSVILNLPFALASYDGWSVFFRFNQYRGPNIDSIWSGLWVMSDKIFGPDFPLKTHYIPWVNLASLALLLVGFLFLTIRYWKLDHPEVSRGVHLPGGRQIAPSDFLPLAFCYLVLFLITNKVYSPPYNLWIVPFFALLAPILRHPEPRAPACNALPSNAGRERGAKDLIKTEGDSSVATLPQNDEGKGLGKTAFYGFELSNAFVFFAIFQYFYLTNIKGLVMLPFPWFKITYLGVVARHVFLGILLVRGFFLLLSRKEALADSSTSEVKSADTSEVFLSERKCSNL